MSAEPVDSPYEGITVVGPGREIRFNKGTRAIRLWNLSDGSFGWEFVKDDVITPIRLSREAMNAMLELFARATWGATDTTSDGDGVSQ